MAIILVTGANKGIGLEIVKGIVAKDSSATVYLGARNAELGKAAVESVGSANLHFLHVDLDSQSVLDAAAAALKEKHGKLDVLVNNAGFAFKNAATEPLSVQAARTVEVNYFGTKRVTEAFLPLLLSASNPRIVNVTSQSGLISKVSSPELAARIMSPDLSQSALDALVSEYLTAAKTEKPQTDGWPSSTYSASKIFENALTRVLAAALDAKVHVTATCPGWCRTDMAGDKAPRTAEEGAQTAVGLALGTLSAPTGTFHTDDKQISY